MSDANEKKEIPWGDREMTKGDLALAFGFMGLLIALAWGIIWYAVNHQPGGSDIAAVTPAAATPAAATQMAEAHTEAVALAYPPLAPLPPVSFPPDNPYSDAKAELGKLLYFDTRFSGDGSLSCNSCHPASDGSWGIGSAISFGYPGTIHWRNASTIINSAYYTKLNWDGSATSIERQNDGAWSGAVAGNLDAALAEERMALIPGYVERFNQVFGTDSPTWDQALLSVATFQRTIVSQNVPFDAYLNGDKSAISAEAIAGYELFTGKANCIACHNGPLVSDDSFHVTGVPQAPQFGNNTLSQITLRWEQWAKGVTEEDYNTATEDLGLYYITKIETDRGAFRTPSLRDLCYTAPYMHNGIFTTLEDVVAFYNNGGGSSPYKSPLLQPLNLTAGEQASLLAFLRSVCGDRITLDAPNLPPYAPWDMSEAVASER
jgi:cytochrome c peroxidase